VSGTLQPVKRFGAMGVERQHLADQAGGTPSLDNSVKRGGLMIFWKYVEDNMGISS